MYRATSSDNAAILSWIDILSSYGGSGDLRLLSKTAAHPQYCKFKKYKKFPSFNLTANKPLAPKVFTIKELTKRCISYSHHRQDGNKNQQTF